MRTISLLIDGIGHKLLSTEACDRTFASSEPRSTVVHSLVSLMLYKKCFFLYQKDSVNHNTRKQARLQFLTGKTYVKGFQPLTTSESPLVWLKLNELLKGWFKPMKAR